MRTRKLIVFIAALALAAAACGGSEETEASSEETTTTIAETGTTIPETTTTAAPETTTTAAPETTTTAAPETTTTTAAGVDAAALSEFQGALEQTAAATSGRMSGEITMSGIEGLPTGTEFSMPFTGAFDNDRQVFAFTMDMSGIAELAGEELPPGFEDMFSEMEIRAFGDVAYMRFPFFSAFLGVETEWIRIPADQAGSAAGGFGGGASPTNPTGVLDVFKDADAQITEIGPEEVRGIPTTRYVVIVDMQKLLANATPEERAELEAQGPLPFDELPLEIWIGNDGLVYRYVMEISGDSVEAAPGESFERMTMTFEMFDYGAAIDVEEPDPSNVTDAEEFGGLFDF